MGELTVFRDALAASTAKYATSHKEGAPNDLKAILKTSKVLRRKLMPWQVQVARVASERLLSDVEQYRYKVIILTVPRQSGKTSLMRTILTQRAVYSCGRKSFYTAQTGKDATARWLDLIEDVERSSFGAFVKKRVAAGSQALTVVETGSVISPFAPTAESLHGYTPYDVMLDECFSFTADQGANLLGAIAPAQVTVKSKQLWIVSTAGTLESKFLKDWVERGRASLEDAESTIAYFEWSMEEGADPYDPITWRFHPALGITISEETLSQDSEVLSKAEWLRAYMNRWSATAGGVIDIEMWRDLIDEYASPPKDWKEISVSYEVGRRRSSSAIYACWNDKDSGKPMLMLLEARKGADWVAEYIVELEKKKPRSISADDGGETRVITDEIKTLSPAIKLTILNGKEFSTASTAMLAAISDKTFSHDGDSGFLDSCINVATRQVGDTRTFSRHLSSGPIPELVAATVALRAHSTGPAPAAKPYIHSQ